MKSLKDIVLTNLKSTTPNYTKFLLGFTGGVDSTVLLHLFTELQKSGDIVSAEAVHIYNNRNAHKVNEVKIACENIGIKLRLDSFVYENDKNVEATGRNLRYNKIQDMLAIDEAFLTAHHLDDNIENFFIRLLRGSGVDGLSSIKMSRDFGTSHQIRPFLSIPKQMLIDYAVSNNLHWIEDPDNSDLRFTRNLIRKKILPNIATFFPHYQTTINRSISNLVQAQDMLAQKEFSEQLSIELLNTLSEEQKMYMIREWIKSQINYTINKGATEEILKQITSFSPRISIPLGKKFLLEKLNKKFLRIIPYNTEDKFSSRSKKD